MLLSKETMDRLVIDLVAGRIELNDFDTHLDLGPVFQTDIETAFNFRLFSASDFLQVSISRCMDSHSVNHFSFIRIIYSLEEKVVREVSLN
jgi:hypothetical protein